MPVASRLRPFVVASVLIAAPTAFAGGAPTDLVQRGEYLARAGDCFGCHTQPGGAPLAGGRQIETPYGTIAAPNITPDKETGIGTWSDDDFYRLMHDGVDPDGQYVYPVMPFDHYTKVTRGDVLAIKAYLFSVKPVHAPQPPSHLAFPFNIRASLGVWRTLFFRAGSFQPDPTRSDALNRGAYLVEGLGHCGACHTPRNVLSGSKQNQKLAGGELAGQGWFAPNITSDMQQGIGSWSPQQLVDYLKSGVAPGKAVVAGPMTEVVHSSLQYLTDADLAAIAADLKAAPAKATYTAQTPAQAPGATAYLTHCASCHQPDGRGIQGAVPALAGNGTVKAGGAQDVIRTILGGMPAQGSYGPMPGLSTAITSAQIAGITNYVRAAWGNAAPGTATVAMVDDLAKRTPTMLAGTAPCAPVGPAPLAAALADQGSGLGDLLHQVTPTTMLTQIDAMIGKLKQSGLGVVQADLVNGLTAAYCPIVHADAELGPNEQVRQLQRFATLVYSRLATPSGQQGQAAAGN